MSGTAPSQLYHDIEILKALTPLAWPLIASFILWKLFPAIRSIVNSRSFSVKVAGMEVSVQDATEQISSRIDDLQKQVIALREQTMGAQAATIGAMPDADQPAAQQAAHKVVLWVDDNPNNNAFEIAHLTELGVEVITSVSTDEALEILQNRSDIGAVVSDMGRREGGRYQGQAGLNLLVALRKAGNGTPFLVYSSAKYAASNNSQIIAAQGAGATSSQIELLQWLRSQLGIASS